MWGIEVPSYNKFSTKRVDKGRAGMINLGRQYPIKILIASDSITRKGIGWNIVLSKIVRDMGFDFYRGSLDLHDLCHHSSSYGPKIYSQVSFGRCSVQ